MTRDELRDLLIDAKELVKKLNEVWCCFEDEEIQHLTEIKHLPCDACEKGEENEIV